MSVSVYVYYVVMYTSTQSFNAVLFYHCFLLYMQKSVFSCSPVCLRVCLPNDHFRIKNHFETF